jgi:hypothetical protein
LWGCREFARRAVAGAIIGGALLGAGGASANIVYTVNQSIGVGSVTGTLETDGVIGTLGTGDFVHWNLLLTGAGGVTYNLVDGTSSVLVSGSDLTAIGKDIVFNFSGDASSYFLIQHTLFSGQNYWCNAAASEVCYEGKSDVPGSIFDASAQVESAVGLQVIATTGVPEPATWALIVLGFAGVGFAVRRGAARAIG